MARHQLWATVAAAAIVTGWPAAAQAAPDSEIAAALAQLQQQLTAQAERLAAQEQQLKAQTVRIEAQNAEIAQLRRMTDAALATSRGAGPASVVATAPQAAAPAAAAPPQAPPPIQLAQAAPAVGAPVGEPPPEPERVVVDSIPEGQGVLTPRGRFSLEPQIDYTHGSTNRLVFRGVVLVNAVQIGLIDASNADRNATSIALDGKFGVTNRLEVGARIPYVYRADRALTLSQNDKTITRELNLRGSDLGDIEASARYQINSGAGGWPIFIGGLRVKSDTGSNPFTVERDEWGIATELATGSGFWGLEGSLTFLYPTDPAVLFGGIGYFHHFAKNIDREIGEVFVGRVDPGDSINANLGFGFALNPRFSFSLGYKHTYVFGTDTELGATVQQSDSLQVGQFNLGWSFQLTERLTLTNTYSVGATRDAPDMEVVFRLPVRF